MLKNCNDSKSYFQPSLPKIKQESSFFPEYADLHGSKVETFCLLSWRGGKGEGDMACM